jgi:Tol biopolymer transport system component
VHLGAVLAATAALASHGQAPLPDGMLAFSGACQACPTAGDGPAVFTITPGQKGVRLAVPKASDPRWSRTGREFAFDRDGPTGSFPRSEIWRSRWDGSGVQRLTSDHSDNEADWSPNGQRLVFVRTDSDAAPAARSALWTVRRDGSGARLLVRARMGGVRDPDWSPDGRRIVFAASVDRLYEVGGTGQDLRLLRIRGRTARWSPDGRSLAFVAPMKDGVALRVINRRTGRIRTLDTNKTGLAQTALAWSADGRWLAYGRAREVRDPIGGISHTYDLWCLRVSDLRRRLILRGVTLEGLDWRP